MKAALPRWLAYRSSLDDRDLYAGMTPEQRLEIFEEVCELSRTILEGRADRATIFAENEPMPPSAEATWLRLVREARLAKPSW